MGFQLYPKKRAKPPPNFWPLYCGQMAGRIKMPLGTEVNLGPGDVVLDGVAAAPPKRGTAPHFTSYVCYGQTAGWIKMPLGTELGLSPGDVLDVDPAPPLSGPCLLWPNGRPS